jgi:segregation and condensation protein B
MHGLELVESKGSYAFCRLRLARPACVIAIGRKVDRRLSKAALETLSIIA